jgi:hypothetical protein
MLKSRYFCLVPDLRENAFSFSPCGMILTVGLSYIAFIMLRYDIPISNVFSTFIKREI